MILKEELREHQTFAEFLCWALAVHLFRGKGRNNLVLPPSLQDDFFARLERIHGRRKEILDKCFPGMDTGTFDDYRKGRLLMDIPTWNNHVLRLGNGGELGPCDVADLRRNVRNLESAHAALVQCRSVFSKKTWGRLVDHKGRMLFSWPVPGERFVQQELGQRQPKPWSVTEDFLERGPKSIPALEAKVVKWWPDRCPLVWRIAITPYPMRFDKKPRATGQWAVRLVMDPFEAVYAKMKETERYRRLPPEWGSCHYEETLEMMRAQSPMFARP
ncbi:hypothetical protein [Pseudoxanthomonas jiangsuensis]|uniref:hypothetical protein n=1 Tax=Pseudoxanthomonas jiangsuensis TaxID=619688 RepID=UPI001390BF73|nr:hypothetical protein [Pseudoxanthomonas jiangsuensis]